eukprot:scaffold185398_cov22-Tisochrysis_lutea.AAC.1
MSTPVAACTTLAAATPPNAEPTPATETPPPTTETPLVTATPDEEVPRDATWTLDETKAALLSSDPP